jgi:hypothetical protein
MTIKKVAFFIALVVVGLISVACERVRIADINADPGRFLNKEVAVVGTVTQSIGAGIGSFGAGVYQVDDGSGRLWVLAKGRGVPAKGAKVGVKGHVSQSVVFLGINYATILQESDRRHG